MLVIVLVGTAEMIRLSIAEGTVDGWPSLSTKHEAINLKKF
jgi:hypothetical protein